MVILIFVFGIVIGSFLNVVILRLPHGRKTNGRSECPHCHNVLSAGELVPIFSYLWLKGKCRHCRTKISRRYLYIEIISGLLAALTYLIYPVADLLSLIVFLRALFIVFTLIVVFSIDYEHGLILDRVVFPATFILFFINFVIDFIRPATWQNSLVLFGLLSGFGLFLFFGALHYLSKGRSMGFGDVKLSAFLGLATPGALLLMNLFFAFFLGSLVGGLLIIFKGRKLKSQVPFGTFLAIGTLVALYFGLPLLHWYLLFIGWPSIP